MNVYTFHLLIMQYLLKIIYAAATAALVTLLTGCSSYLHPEKSYQSIVKQAPFDVIIVPGFPHQQGNWNIVVKSRVYWAVFLYQQGITKNIIFSGSAVYTPYVEGEVMALYAEQLGVPRGRIFIETQAEHTAENLYYSYVLAKQYDFKSIAVASDAVQCQLLKKFRHKFHVYEVQFIPIVYDYLDLKGKKDPHINDQIAFVSDFRSLRERENFLKRYRGTCGRKIKQLIKQDKANLNDKACIGEKQTRE
jgi:hypothetical protein